MSTVNVIRAWKDAEYRRGLTDEQRARVPAHPSGEIEFLELDFVYGSITPKTKSPCHKCGSCSGAR